MAGVENNLRSATVIEETKTRNSHKDSHKRNLKRANTTSRDNNPRLDPFIFFHFLNLF